MQSIKTIEGLKTVDDNKIFYKDIKFDKSEVRIDGKNNIIYFENGVQLAGSRIVIDGDDNIVYISKGRGPIRIVVTLFGKSIFYLGKNCSFRGISKMILSEGKNIIIGNDCMFATGTRIRNSDAHLLYNSQTKKRVSEGESIYFGDHIWIGEDVKILKGVHVGSGSVIGAYTILTKDIPSNTIFAGNPSKLIKENISWDRKSTHKIYDDQKSEYEDLKSEDFIYSKAEKTLSMKLIESVLNEEKNLNKKFNILRAIYKEDGKNRFYL